MLEWRFAAQWSGVSYKEFEELDGDEQSRVVAAYRSHIQIAAVEAREQARALQRSSRHSGRGKGRPGGRRW
jgi:hypothetical protein